MELRYAGARGYRMQTEERTDTCVFRMRDDGILHGTALPDRQQTLEDARANLAAASRASEGVQAPLLLDVRRTGTLSREARQLYAGEDGAQVITALAFVANTAFTRVVGNFFIKLAKTRYPVRLFSRESEAIEWLEAYRP